MLIQLLREGSSTYEWAVDAREEVQNPDGSWDFLPSTDRLIEFEIHHRGDDNEHNLIGIHAIHGDVSAKELAEAVNDYLDLYINPIKDQIDG